MCSAGTTNSARSMPSSTGRRTAGMAGLVLEGEAGIGKSTIWLAGVEAARERGLRVLSSRPAEVELGVDHAGWETSSKTHSRKWGDELEAHRRRALETALLLGEEAGAPVDFRTLAVAVRSALHLLAERAADPARGRRRPVARCAVEEPPWEFALRRLQGENIRLLLARRLGGGTEGSELELALDERDRSSAGASARSARARCTGILQPRLGRSFARPTLLRLHEASGGNPFFALELARVLGTRRRSDAAAARPGDIGGARPRSPRRPARRDAPSAAARLHARAAEARTARRGTMPSSPRSPTT